MNATVIGFRKGFTERQRWPYITAVLSCGHVAKVELKPTILACVECGARTQRAYDGPSEGPCACGAWHYSYVWQPQLHEDADRVTREGDVVNCETCDAEARQLAWLRALPREVVQHARYRQWCGTGQYHFYRRDTSSPTGVMLIGSVDATPAVEAELRAKRISPLSPTEPR